MPYTVNKLAQLAGVSVRTLHYYDEVGLLKPSKIEKNGYRSYEERELLKLQQIMFFRELDFPVEEIKKIMSSPAFDMRQALRDHRVMIELKKKRLAGLIKTIDKTIQKLDSKKPMDEKDMQEAFDTFGEDTVKKYAEEVKQRWGHTEAYKQSMERYAKTTKEDMEKYKKDADIFMKKAAEVSAHGALSPEFQEIIAQHFDALRTWYEPNFEMYRGLAKMYVDDPRFTAYYEKYKPGLAKIFSEAMLYYADQNEPKK
ncbi:MerR family transcriptional regulator [Patescibacteria group bacterium]|jgi:DNA-binding transcriptional MerR regulator|nr:MerR family transcriptional regulator [Patescibacteria group bacterium]